MVYRCRACCKVVESCYSDGLQTLARAEQVFSYHSGTDREMQRMTPNLAYGHDKLAGEAFRASLGMFSKPARQHALPRISNETELVNYMGRKQAAETAETHYVKGALNITSEEETSIHSFAEIKMESEDETNIASKKNI